MNSLRQLSQSTRLSGVFSLLEVYYCAPGNSGLTRERLTNISGRLLVGTRGKSHPPGLSLPILCGRMIRARFVSYRELSVGGQCVYR
jgi:hypothetical protein